ncbi:general substrate transporter [Yamadazyma tenuis ATCC 10573]|uniref:General substrate transporter n=1 Tax=Candida tenuis (strain ATCC 10573 / BCRC 21748 / CBS 615 / JCM 9827 / NBRC 10315 / NRRL Y-1498 / VKM Y-70) TaxID=590646 RepID=G3B0Q6_CANTC|nr:general substrate transporter [Yamadazyma tenuis ATCC 10573]EGV65449.1 general substrate transporter [Yamadazyma tenuis ATCC 10573]
MKFKFTSLEQIVGPAIAKVLPDHQKPWFQVRHLLKLNLLLLVPLSVSSTAGYDGSLMNGLQSIDPWKAYFNQPHGTMLGFVNAAQNCGCFIMLPLCGWLTDYIGRKFTIAIGLLGVIVATIIQAAAHNLGATIAARFIVGAFGMLAVQPAPLLIAELSYPSYRGKMTSLYWTFYYLGAILASWTCFGTQGRNDNYSWRIPTILQAGFPVLQLVFIWFVPESPRWLISKGKNDKARAILVEHHAGGDEDSELVNVEMSEIVATLEMEGAAKSTKWSDLVSTPGNRRRTYIAVSLGVFAQWNGIAVVSYYLTLVLNTIGITSSTMQTLINGLLQIFNLIAASSAALLVDLLGRRTLFLWSGIGMLVSYIIWTACSAIFAEKGTPGAGKAVVAFIFIFYFHYDIAYTPLLMGYPTEIFPYYLRSKGVAAELMGVYGALIIASFCNSIALDNIGWKYYIVFCVLLVIICLNTYYFYPETKGYSLEEVAQIFDGNEAILDVTSGDLMKHGSAKTSQEHVERVREL